MVITLSRQYGTGAISVADLVAARLALSIIDQELPTVVAARLGTSREVVAAREGQQPFVERVLRGLGAGTPDLHHPAAGTPRSFDETMRRETEAAVREYAARDNVIIIGRAANKILGRGPGILRVFLQAPPEWRRQRIIDWHHVTAKEADAEIGRMDAARSAYTREYAFTYGDVREYDVTLDVSRFGIEGTAELIIAAAKTAEHSA